VNALGYFLGSVDYAREHNSHFIFAYFDVKTTAQRLWPQSSSSQFVGLSPPADKKMRCPEVVQWTSTLFGEESNLSRLARMGAFKPRFELPPSRADEISRTSKPIPPGPFLPIADTDAEEIGLFSFNL